MAEEAKCFVYSLVKSTLYLLTMRIDEAKVARLEARDEI
jgi:hypothetical protein